MDVQNVREVFWKALNNIDPDRDIQFTLRYAARPGVIRMSAEVKQQVDVLWKKAGL
jgi:hypothetical protein